MKLFGALFSGNLPLIGVVHLPAFPGYKDAPDVETIVTHALTDLAVLESLGYEGLLIENENDQPHRLLAGPETIAVMTRVVSEAVRAAKSIIVGAEILLNDPKASLAVAKASGARFIRTDYFVDRMGRPEYGGEMAIDAPGLLTYRRQIEADKQVAIMADVQVKYAQMLEAKTVSESVRQARAAGADAIIVTGQLTGDAPVVDHLREAHEAAEGHPILIGSGLTAQNAEAVMRYVDGAIVGTGIMTNGKMDKIKAAQLMEVVSRMRVRV